MKIRPLGKTGLEVSELALGGLFVSDVGGAKEQGIATIHRALELGVNYIDTAPAYHDSEVVIGEALRGVSPQPIVSTKLGYRPEPFEPLNKDFLRRSVENSLRVLGRDYLDILMIHEPDRRAPQFMDWWTDYENYRGPVLDLMLELKEEGLVKHMGLGGTTPYAMPPVIRTGNFEMLLTAFQYSLLWREAEWEVLPAAVEQGMGIVIGSPLQQGWLAERVDDQLDDPAIGLNLPRRRQFRALYSYLDEINLPLVEVALRWVISNPNVSTVLMGARLPEHVEQNVAAIEKGPLPSEVMASLKIIADMVPFRPYDESYGTPFKLSWK
ncbi:MAG: aldo/keto reductase [candidate division WS1 bacterium]|nr:aldo/keto reductase [candidate division WS1 bacterium]